MLLVSTTQATNQMSENMLVLIYTTQLILVTLIFKCYVVHRSTTGVSCSQDIQQEQDR